MIGRANERKPKDLSSWYRERESTLSGDDNGGVAALTECTVWVNG